MVMALLQEIQNNGVGGGDFLTGAWRTRPINTISSDLNSLISGPIVSGRFTLKPGYYFFDAEANGNRVDNHQIALFNVLTGAHVLYGKSTYAPATEAAQNKSRLLGAYQISQNTDFELQHICSVSQAGNGFGVNAGLGNINIYSSIAIYVIGT